jgi:hypothetical protein
MEGMRTMDNNEMEQIIHELTMLVMAVTQSTNMVTTRWKHFNRINRTYNKLGKVLAGYRQVEEVTLEGLTEEELLEEYESWTDINPDDEYQMKGLRGITQATIDKIKQGSKLYRVKD